MTDTASGPHDREEYIQPKKQAPLDAEDLGSSYSAATELPSQPAKEAVLQESKIS